MVDTASFNKKKSILLLIQLGCMNKYKIWWYILKKNKEYAYMVRFDLLPTVKALVAQLIIAAIILR